MSQSFVCSPQIPMPIRNEHAGLSMRLYNREAGRLYLNAAEREAFLTAAMRAPDPIKAFALTLLYSGCRLSEARNLTYANIQTDPATLAIRSLKKRAVHHVREIPIPNELVACFNLGMGQNRDQKIWPNLDRVTAWRWIKRLMAEANIQGAQACPKGLRHGFGVHAICAGVSLNMLQRWMGHTSIETTLIYTQAVGLEERKIAERMWG